MSHKSLLTFSVTILSIIGYGAFVFAAQLPDGTTPPVGGYAAGDYILDPGCAPGATDCYKNIGAGWSLTGDAGTDGGVNNFIGTTDAQDFVIKTNGVQIGKFGQNGNVAVGSANTLYSAAAPVASGDFSFALGYDTVASGLGSFAGGYGAVSSRENSFAWGSFSTASGDGAVAFGQGTVASALNAVALNEQTTAAGTRSLATGNGTYANGFASSSFGQNSRAEGDLSFTQGRNTVGASFLETVFGIYNTPYVPISTSSVNAADRLFTVGNGSGIGNESDAFTILKNGKTGIGYDNFETTISNALLQINGGILAAGLTNCQIITTDADGLMSCATASSLIGSTSGVSSTPTAGLTNETWLGDGAGGTGASSVYTTFLGVGAGDSATSADVAVFIGAYAGTSATNASNAVFIGQQTGVGATNASYSNFLGNLAGSGATGATNSNFFGFNAGANATGAQYSNFFGTDAGSGATTGTSSNFIGPNAGQNAANAYYSSFIGASAGSGATNAARSIFIGHQAGASDTVDNRFGTPSSILIGNNTSTGGFSNSIAIGRSATNTSANQFMIGSSASPIDTTRINGSAATQCTITTGTGIACTSDERVKTNISDLVNTTLDTLVKVRTVTYNWLENPTSKQQVGFLAQDLEHYFPALVETDKDGMKSVYYAQMTPILVEAIRELNLKTEAINSLSGGSFIEHLKNWLGDVNNGITLIYAQVFKSQKVQTDELCVGSVCVTSEQFLNMVQGTTSSNQGQLPPSEPLVENPDPAPAPTPDSEITDPEALPETTIDTSAGTNEQPAQPEAQPENL